MTNEIFRRLSALALSLALLLNAAPLPQAFAVEDDTDASSSDSADSTDTADKTAVTTADSDPTVTAAAANAPALDATAALLVSPESDMVLYEKNADEKRYPASTTKIMTALLTLENVSDLSVVVTAEASDFENVTSDSSNAGIKVGEQVTVKDLLLSDDDTIIEDLMDTNVIFASTTEDQESVSEKFSDYDLMALPVVDKEGRLVGIVTVDDVIDVMEQETTEDFEIMAGMTPSDKPYSRSGIIEMWKNRIPWLMFLMLSATFTSMILTSFENRLAVQAGLIAFIPMLMGTGGNSGAQASTAVIRSLSLGDTEPRDALRVVWKELRVALLCGVTLAAVNFIKMLLIDRLLLGNANVTVLVSVTVSLSIVFVVMFAKVVGSMLPIAAEKIGVDPAVMANPLISTVTDAVSLLIYIYVAKLVLHI